MVDVAREDDAPLEPEPLHCLAHLLAAALLCADEDEVELAVEERERLDRRQRILPRLDPADEEHVRSPVRGVAVRMEDGIDPVRRDDDPVLGDPVLLHEVVLRVLRDGQHTVGAPSRGRDEPPEEHAVAAPHQPRHALEREVVHRDHRAAAIARRDDVVEVRQRRPQAPEESRQPVGHPHRLAAGRELDRLDSVGHEVRAARNRRQALLVGERRELSQQRRDVRLVPSAATPEHVRVDDDERLHPASSRYRSA